MQENQNADFKSFVKAGLKNLKTSFEQGEEVEGTVSAITKDSIFLDINAKSEGILDRSEFEKEGRLSVREGDTLKAFFVRIEDNGELILTGKVKGNSADNESIENAFRARIPIEGRIEGERKGGYTVIIGSRTAFCPFSQIDINPSPDRALYVGRRCSFMISEYSTSDFVVSRREFLEMELEKNLKQLRETLQEGDVVTGVVKRIMNFGVFVDIGGIDGLVPMRELAWGHVKSAEDVVSVGEEITVKLIKVQWNDNRLTLSLKQVGEDPWSRVKENYHATKQYVGTVTKLTPFGAFVALEPGVEGLVHISKLGAGKRVTHASEILTEDQEISVFVESIDPDNHRISLTLENPQEGRAIDLDKGSVKVGEVCQGVVEDIKPFGVFVKLSPSVTALLHISEIPSTSQANTVKSLFKRYPPGSELQVVVKNVSQDKISLTLPNSSKDDQDEYRQFLTEKKKGDGFGNLGSAFDHIQM